MITLLAALTGFLSSLLPHALQFYRDRDDRKHELAILDKQLAMQKAGISERVREIELASDLQEAVALYKTYRTGIFWVDALNGSVRPVLAYAFFALYACVKLLQWEMLALSAAPLLARIEILWSLEDQAIFAGIISFYYGQRALQKR